MGIRKTIYIVNEDLWTEVETEAEKSGKKPIEVLLSAFADRQKSSEDKPDEKEPVRVDDGAADRLRQKMRDRGEPVMTDDELAEYRATSDPGEKNALLYAWQKRNGVYPETSGRYARPITAKEHHKAMFPGKACLKCKRANKDCTCAD